jgi:hypothetical protein
MGWMEEWSFIFLIIRNMPEYKMSWIEICEVLEPTK